jgi:hypothetical protein
MLQGPILESTGLVWWRFWRILRNGPNRYNKTELSNL